MFILKFVENIFKS